MKPLKITLLLILPLLLMINGCGKDDDEPTNPLIGSWARSFEQPQDGVGELVTEIETVTFRSNGTGMITYTYESDGSESSPTFEFTYTSTDDELSITYETPSVTGAGVTGSGTQEVTDVLPYSISGNQLSITEEDGETLVFTKI